MHPVTKENYKLLEAIKAEEIARGRIESPEPVTVNAVRMRLRRNGWRAYKQPSELPRRGEVLKKHPARPGEIQLKQFLSLEAERLKCHRMQVYESLRNRGYPGIKIRRVNARVVFVTPTTAKGRA